MSEKAVKFILIIDYSQILVFLVTMYSGDVGHCSFNKNHDYVILKGLNVL